MEFSTDAAASTDMSRVLPLAAENIVPLNIPSESIPTEEFVLENQTGERFVESDVPAWLISLVVHMLLTVGLGLIGFENSEPPAPLTIAVVPLDEPEIEEPEKPEDPEITDVETSDEPVETVGAQQEAPDDAPENEPEEAPIEEDEIVKLEEVDELLVDESDLLASDDDLTETLSLNVSDSITKRKNAGRGESGAAGAIDRITEEILLSLEQRKTLVVWYFDQSNSLVRQREEIRQRFDRIYAELGILETSGNPAFKNLADKPLLTSVVAFGRQPTLMTKRPTDNLHEIKAAVADIQIDPSGDENVFGAVIFGAEKYKKYTTVNDRRVMHIIVSDEVGDDRNRLDSAVQICRKYKMPVYVVGVPAPFGRAITKIKYVHPDKKYDQSPQWGVVQQGPESLFPERVKLHFSGGGQTDEPISSGFGPYSLTRLSHETNGLYFSIHPNRNWKRSVGRSEIANLSAHLKYFFDPAIMRKYQPDYLPVAEYQKMVSRNKAKWALLQAGNAKGFITPLGGPNLRFPKRSDGDLARRLTNAQKAAAKLEPKIINLYLILKAGQSDRAKLTEPRWQVGYDLGIGRVLAAKVRTQAYNHMLAKAKSMKFKDKKSDTWILKPASFADSQWPTSLLKKEADAANAYLTRVVKEHPETPWALLAQKELDIPLGWKWTELYAGVNKPRNNPGNGGRPRPPANDKKRMLKKPPPKAPLPKF